MSFSIPRMAFDRVASRLPRTTRHRVYRSAAPLFARLPPRLWPEGGGEYSMGCVSRHRCIFIHIPKTAGISVARALFGSKGAGHARAADYLATIGAEDFDCLFKFSIVKNPYDRLISAYWYLMAGGMSEGDRKIAEEFLGKFGGFDSFVLHGLDEAAESQVHFMPQWTFLLDPRTNRICTDLLVPFEEMDAGFAEICRRLGRNVVLPRLNVAQRRPARGALTPDLEAAIRRVYRSDFDLLGYGQDGMPPA